MNILKKSLFTTALMTAMIGMASASVVTSTNTTSQAINDNTSLTSNINFGTHGSINSLFVTVAATHSWVGDLIYSLSNGTTTIDLMNRPGNPAAGFGNSANLVFTSPLSFSDSASTAAESIGAGCSIVGASAGCLNTSFLPEQALSAFAGADVFGDWILTISDNAGGDTGSLASWTLTANVGNNVPEPGSLALLGLGLAGLAYNSRKRKAQPTAA